MELQRLVILAMLLMAANTALGLDVAVPQPADFSSRVDRVEIDSDLDGALALITELQQRITQDPSKENLLLLGRAALVAAEVRRYNYEKATEMDPRDRRLLGRTIDDIAKIGHDALDQVPNDVSEKWRMKADLYGTMIRSSYKGNKYVGDMEDATKKAVDLDPKNPFALLTASKRPLFAEEEHGGNIPEAMDLLNQALILNPKFERAITFRGVAFEKLGQTDKAIAEWKRALEINPKSRLAKDKLVEHHALAG